MAGEIDINTVAKAYARWAPVYDFVFGAVFDAGRKASIAAAERIGGRILDVGIGTGISLTDYAPTHRIVGVDYCEPMLRKAHERVAEHKLAHVEALAVMDAQHLGFPDAFFDAVVAQYVITTVPDPEAALDEFARVTKAGGEIILVNHLGAEAGPRRVFEQGFAPVARRLGWRPEFRWQRLARWAERHGGVRLLERRAMPPLGHFSLIRFERLAGANGRLSRIFWPSSRTPITTSSEIDVTFRSSRTAYHGAVEDQAHNRLFGERTGVPASQSPFTFRHTRLTVSLFTAPPNSAFSARRTRRVLMPAR